VNGQNAPRMRGAFCIGRTLAGEVTTLLTFVRWGGESEVASW
jgi:hypothetical protein